MRKLRGAIAVVAALVLAGLAAYAVYGYLGRPRRPEPPPPEPEARAPREEPPPPQRFSNELEAGLCAVTLAVDAVSGVSRDLIAGDRVDVLAVAPIADMPDTRVAHPLVTDARVLAVTAGKADGGRANRNWTAILAVTPADAAVLAAADPAAKLRLVMRHPDNTEASPHAATAFTSDGGGSLFAPQERNLKSLIAPGMRAITLDVAATDGVGGVFQPDDRVDVVVTSVWGNVSLEAQNKPGEKSVLKSTHRNSRILMQNIRVIATDSSLSGSTGPNRRSSRVTLEVTPRDAERLTVLADSKKGRSLLRLISRREDDDRNVATSGAELLDLISDKIPYTSVEMIRGLERKDQTFYR